MNHPLSSRRLKSNPFYNIAGFLTGDRLFRFRFGDLILDHNPLRRQRGSSVDVVGGGEPTPISCISGGYHHSSDKK